MSASYTTTQQLAVDVPQDGHNQELQSAIMATASAGHPALVTPRGSSQFGQFRLTQFVNNAQTPPNATTDANPTSTPLSNLVQEIEQMAQATRPSPGQNLERTPPSLAPSRPIPQDHNHPNLSPRGLSQLELVELTSNPVVEGILGPNKDGRVRNPVPSKLKGKTDNKQGNFGVMHMGLSPGKKTEAQGRDTAAERDAAARRTSENTASRAKAAQQEKYIPPKKRGIEATLNDPASRGSPFAVSKNDDRNRARPLAPDETKFEQARLLTLLRSINPVTVVDQICKAVAYFGGIPGAPPPEDGIFPESANTRETGALFIGWVAEIFPDLSSRSPEVATKDTPQNAAGKKKDGRPSAGKQSISSSGERGVSNEPPNSRNGYGYGPAVSAPAWGLPQSLALVNTPIPVPVAAESGQTAGLGHEHSKPSEHPPVTPVKVQQDDLDNTSTSKRRRGRPKGSRNKAGKGDGQQDAADSNNAESGQQNNQASGGQQTHQSPEVSSNTAQHTAPNQDSTIFATSANNHAKAQKPVQSYQYPPSAWPSNSQKNQVNQTVIPPVDELSPEERAVLEAFRHHGPDSGTNAVPPPVVSVKDSTGYVMGGETKKRKRAPAKPKTIPIPANTIPANTISATTIPAPNPPADSLQTAQKASSFTPNNAAPMAMAKDAMQWTSVGTSTPIIPPAKKPRQRKPKASGPSDPPSRHQTASVVSSVTPPIPPSTIPDSQTPASQQSLPVSRLPAEGLEAHYERFANLQQSNLQQQNGRDHTPTQPQQQQQVRQQSKPASVTPRQSTPQLQHQQMQQQKSQQGSQQSLQRDDPKATQGSSIRSSSSATYYNNQRSQGSTSYSQQYPSHQPSQLYAGHQASPQLSNNSYRTSSTHTLAQASPQFSQSENSYKTASPHAIAQPSPSFSQTESNFRTTSAHSIPQPTTSYSQAENTYRTSSTHSITQPTSSYTSSRTHIQPQTSHQSHYNHFSDSSYIDLPTLESLGHSGTSASTGVGMSASGYGQAIGVGLGASRSTGSSNSLYGASSGLSNAFDASTNDLLRGVSRSGSNSNSAYGTSSGLGAFDTTGTSEHEMRERLLRGLGRR